MAAGLQQVALYYVETTAESRNRWW